MEESPERRLARWQVKVAFGALLVCAAAYVFADIGRPFNQTDDFWYAEIVSRMIEDGDYVVPRFGPDPDFNKPPLFYWLSVPGRVFVPDVEAGMRLVPGLAFLLTIALIYSMGARHSDVAGLVASLVFATTYDHLHHHGFKSGVPEPVLALEIAGVLALSLGLGRSPWRLVGISALIGAAFLTKTAFAAIGVVVAAPAVVRLHRRGGGLATKALVSAGVLVATVVPWFVLVISREGTAVLDRMFLDQVFGRLVNDVSALELGGRTFGRTEPGFILRHVLTWGAPWSLCAIGASIGLVRRFRALEEPTRQLLVGCAAWTGFVFAGLLASRASWGWYASSAYVPISLVLGVFASDWIRNGERTGTRAALACTVGASALLAVPLSYNPYTKSSGPAPLDLAIGIQLLIAAGAAVLLRRRVVSAPGAPTPAWAGVLPVALALLLLAAGAFISFAAPALARTGLAALLCVPVFAVSWYVAPALSRPGLRAAALLPIAACALAYISAPLAHLGEDRRPADIRWMQAQIARGAFDQGRQMRLRVSVYNYVRFYQAFHRTHHVEYDPMSRILSVRARGGTEEATLRAR